jgi:hypothetical protein
VNTTGDRNISTFLAVLRKAAQFDVVMFTPNIASNRFTIKGCLSSYCHFQNSVDIAT